MNPESVLMIDPQVHDLGGFSVSRVLPHRLARHVGPFVFFDHIGPARFAAGRGIDVRPHPHIGLATVTYLFDGALEHRDSLGSVQIIRPGDVNWMTAGRGIAHSERTPSVERAAGHGMHGIQTWVALPQASEEAAPGFHHHPASSLPQIDRGGVRLRLIAGDAYGQRSPVATFSGMFYLAAEFTPGSAIVLPPEHVERAVYATDVGLRLAGVELAPGRLAVLPPGENVEISATATTRALLFGGEPLDGERHLWWNFVSSSRERIERAKAEWKAGSFAPVPGDPEFIPLPAIFAMAGVAGDSYLFNRGRQGDTVAGRRDRCQRIAQVLGVIAEWRIGGVIRIEHLFKVACQWLHQGQIRRRGFCVAAVQLQVMPKHGQVVLHHVHDAARIGIALIQRIDRDRATRSAQENAKQEQNERGQNCFAHGASHPDSSKNQTIQK